MLPNLVAEMQMRKAYLYYAAGQAVAAAHLGLKIKQVSADPLQAPTDIVVPREDAKSRVILWLTGTAVERKALGRASPLRRMRNRERIRVELAALAELQSGSAAKRKREARRVFTQAQDRANAITTHLFEAVEEIVAKLETDAVVEGDLVVRSVRDAKWRMSRRNPDAKIDD